MSHATTVPPKARSGAGTSGATQAPAVDARGLTKRFRQGASTINALNGVALRIEHGEFVAIMGASGSGKSTLLHLLAGLTRPDEGVVSIAGRDVAAMSDRELTPFRRRHIGFVFQSYNLIPTLSVEDNILLPRVADGASDGNAERLAELLDSLTLSDCRGRRPDTLSGGEQQRVAIARALIGSPSVVLADEPTGNLDSINGQSLCDLLRQLNERDRQAIALVTHDPSVALWSDRIVVLKDGKSIAELATSDLSEPKHLAAAFAELNAASQAGGAR